MKFLLLYSLLLSSPLDCFEKLIIERNNESIAEIDKSDFMFPAPVHPFVNHRKVNELVFDINEQVYREPIDAKIDVDGKIIPEQLGIRLNKKAFLVQFYHNMYNNRSIEMEIPIQSIIPRVDSELISDIKTDMIGYYVTYYNRNNRQRSHNIMLAAEAINNSVVFPGEKFSFNQVVGERTKMKGYLPAPVIVRGEVSEGIGGGICQVSSTLFNAVDGCGLQILERFSHSKRVPYVPPGRDATVSWFGPDLSFLNKYNQPILIRARAQEGMMIVMIFSNESVDYIKRNIPRMSLELPKEVPAS